MLAMAPSAIERAYYACESPGGHRGIRNHAAARRRGAHCGHARLCRCAQGARRTPARRCLQARGIPRRDRCRTHGAGAGRHKRARFPGVFLQFESCEAHRAAAACRRVPAQLLLVTEGPSRKALAERVKRANALGADLFLSIHHDSVPDKFLEKWEFEGQQHGFSDRFHGHSIFISNDNSDRAGSLLYARLLGNELGKRKLQYTPHYTERYMGHRQRLLVDAQGGVYRYDALIVLRDTDMPAVLLEAGSIINREEELRMGSVERQTLISAAVTDAVEAFCAARRPRTP